MRDRLTKVRESEGLPRMAVFPPATVLRQVMQGYPNLETAVDEWTALDESMRQAVEARASIEKISVTVIARGKPGALPGVPPDRMAPFDVAWREMQEQLARSFPKAGF